MRSICSKCSYLLICDALHKDSTVECEDFKSNIITNGDKLRSMTDEELAGWLERIRLCCATDLCGKICPFSEVCYSSAEAPKETLDWLKQEVNK